MIILIHETKGRNIKEKSHMSNVKSLRNTHFMRLKSNFIHFCQTLNASVDMIIIPWSCTLTTQHCNGQYNVIIKALQLKPRVATHVFQWSSDAFLGNNSPTSHASGQIDKIWSLTSLNPNPLLRLASHPQQSLSSHPNPLPRLVIHPQ
jgi:hypothetical protein